MADIIGAGREATVAITSAVPIPDRYVLRGSHVPVPELPLQNRQGDALAGELDSVGMPKLMCGKAAPDAGIGGELAELGAHRGA